MWVVITVLFVCWFPSLDAASVVEKSIQRLYGTAIGAAVGLLCGFLSLTLLGSEEGNALLMGPQATFVLCCIAAYTFVICWAAVQFQVKGTKIIAKYNYACILCLLTFYICLLPFYCTEEKKWLRAMYRVINVIVGCIIGAGLSISVLPRSTVRILRRKIETQILLAGEASQAVLHNAADSFSESAYVPIALAEEMLESPGHRSIREQLTVSRRPWRNSVGAVDKGGDGTLEKYEDAIKEWRNIKLQLGKLKFDPFNIGLPDDLISSFRTEMANTMARTLRIQNTVILLDGIVRNDPKHDFNETHINLFAGIGTLIRQMLTLPLNTETDGAAKKLKAKLAQVRGFIIELSSVVAASSQQVPTNEVGTLGVDIRCSRLDLAGMDPPELSEMHKPDSFQEDDKGGMGVPKHVHGSRVCALLFLQLVEHMALRSVRLYESYKKCEDILHAAEKQSKKVVGFLER